MRILGKSARARPRSAAILLGAVLALVAAQSPALAEPIGKPAAPGTQAAPPPSNTDPAVTQALQALLSPALTVAADGNVRAIVRYLVSQQADGETSALFSTIIQTAEESGVVDPFAPEWLALKNTVASFANVNGHAYQPQVYIPFQDEGAAEGWDVVMAVTPTDEQAVSVTGYVLDGNLQPQPAVTVDEAYAQENEVWVLSVNDPVPTDEGSTATSTVKVLPADDPSVAGRDLGTQTVCNPTGLRNNNGREYLKSWRVPDESSFGGFLEGKREMRLTIITSTGQILRNIAFPKVKKKNIDEWQNSDTFITTWDRALYGDVWKYVWFEHDEGPSLTINIPIPVIGGTIALSISSSDDVGGDALVRFSESTTQEYDTGLVRFNMCTQGGDGGTGNDNLACGALAAASSTYWDYSPARVSDCNHDTRLGPAFSWANAFGTYPPGNPEWVQVDMGVNKTFRRIVVYTTAGFPIRDFDVQIWNGLVYLSVAQIRGNTANSVTINLPTSRTSRLVRVLGFSGPLDQPGYVRVNELEVYPI